MPLDRVSRGSEQNLDKDGARSAILEAMRHPGLLNDIMFKIVFGTQESVTVLRALLNAILGLQGPDKIVDLEILVPSSEKEYLTQKGPILDLRARDGKGQQFNVEVQLRAGVDDYKKRTLFYIAKFYCDQLQKGQGYNSLKRTVSISILDFNLFPNTEELHSNSRCVMTWSFTTSSSRNFLPTSPNS